MDCNSSCDLNKGKKENDIKNNSLKRTFTRRVGKYNCADTQFSYNTLLQRRNKSTLRHQILQFKFRTDTD